MTTPQQTDASDRRQASETAFVVGGGPVGREVATRLTNSGEAVTFLDQSPPSNPPSGQTVRAVDSFEGDALEASGLGDASTVIVLDSDDATNLLVAQLARARFDVDRVLVRLNEPERASVFDRPGIETVDATAAIADAVTDQW